MSTEAHYLDIVLLGKEYRVACPPGEREALQAAVDFVDEKMHDIARKTRSSISERIAVMAALNIAHEHLSLKNAVADDKAKEIPAAPSPDLTDALRMVRNMEAELDRALHPLEETSPQATPASKTA